MKTLSPAGLSLCLFAAAGWLNAADAPKGYDRYTFVRTRNVFDPDRRAMTPAQATSGPAAATGPSPVSLTGTMAIDGKALAFFASPRADYNQVIPVNQAIAGFKVTDISAGIVEIEHDGKRQVLAVGDYLPIPGAVIPPPEAAAATGAAASAPPSAPAGSEDVLKRMLERRQKEMSR